MDLEPAPNFAIHRDGPSAVIRYGDYVMTRDVAECLERLGVRELAAGRRVTLDLTAVHQLDGGAAAALAPLCDQGLLAHRAVIILGAEMIRCAVEARHLGAANDPVVLPPHCVDFAGWR